MESCILWGNSGKSSLPLGDYSFSCVESAVPIEGTGNIHVPPQFAGWPGPEEIFIDPKPLRPATARRRGRSKIFVRPCPATS
jgi:hypothetical protein